MRFTKSNFLDILKQHQRILFKVSNAYGQDPANRDDIVQEIIIQLWLSKHTYDPKYKISTWIYRVSLNVAISHFRKESKRKKLHVGLNDHLINISDNNVANETQDQRLEALHHFITKLEKLNRALILLYLENYSYKEISEILGISETNVATKINRLKKRLKAWFEQEELIKN